MLACDVKWMLYELHLCQFRFLFCHILYIFTFCPWCVMCDVFFYIPYLPLQLIDGFVAHPPITCARIKRPSFGLVFAKNIGLLIRALVSPIPPSLSSAPTLHPPPRHCISLPLLPIISTAKFLKTIVNTEQTMTWLDTVGSQAHIQHITLPVYPPVTRNRCCAMCNVHVHSVFNICNQLHINIL